MPPPPALPPELVEEILLRLPPDQPACLVRASLASKLWFGLLTGTTFRRLYRDRHGDPPMLGFVYSGSPDSTTEEEDNLPYFVATTKFSVRIPRVEDWRGWHKDYTAWDCRHGRVLFSNGDVAPTRLVVWDPLTGRRRLLCTPERYGSCKAAVLCNAIGCNHRACHLGPFQVVFVGLRPTDDGYTAYAHVSLPEVVKWSKTCSLDLATDAAVILNSPPVLIQGALYFMIIMCEGDDYYDDEKTAILKYDLGSNCLLLIDGPHGENGLKDNAVLMALEDGSLGFAEVDRSTFCLWSRHVGSDGVSSWPRRMVINLETFVPIQNPNEFISPIGSVVGSDIIFVSMDHGNYEINVKSRQWKKLWNSGKYRALFPYMSFYTPPESASSGCSALTTHV